MKPLLLVVDDDIDDIESFQEALSQIQDAPELRYFLNAEELLKFFSTKPSGSLPPFAITLDINLPGMNGITLLALLKDDHGMDHIPISIITTSNSTQLKTQCLDKGASNFFTKPVKLNEWLMIIQSIVDGIDVSK